MTNEEFRFACIEKITFSDGQEFIIGDSDITLIVGPNNAGKTQALRDIMLLINPNQVGASVVIKDIQINKLASTEEARHFLDKNASRNAGNYTFKGARVHENYLGWFDTVDHNPPTELLVKLIDANARLNAAISQESISYGDVKQNAHHYMYESDEIACRASTLFKDAFGVDLVVNLRSGKTVHLHVGERPEFDADENLVSESYIKKIRELPLLQTQGDGMKAYAGMIFESVIMGRDIILLDEPEAFLHPPQMRRIGRTLAAESTGQLFVSTHSADVLKGFLEDPKNNVRVIRIEREGDINCAHETSPGDIREFWDSADLKYSNALDGIFHELCVVCEDDSDCKFYNAIRDHLESINNEKKWPDVQFTPAGGKSSFPRIASALHRLGVKVRIAADLDLLADEASIKTCVESLGGNWEDLAKDWQIVNSGVQQGRAPKTNGQISEEIIELLKKRDSGNLPKSKIIRALSKDKAWNTIKQAGVSTIPSGDATNAFNRLDKNLKEIGIYLVPVGELEGFAKSISNHGPKFVNKALSELNLGGDKLSSARDYVSALCS